MLMQVTEALIRNVVQEVLANMKNGRAPVVPVSNRPSSAVVESWGVFENVSDAVKAAVAAQREFEALGLQAQKGGRLHSQDLPG